MEFIEFIFGSFWRFFGFLILILVFAGGISEIIKSFAHVIRAFRGEHTKEEYGEKEMEK